MTSVFVCPGWVRGIAEMAVLLCALELVGGCGQSSSSEGGGDVGLLDDLALADLATVAPADLAASGPRWKLHGSRRSLFAVIWVTDNGRWLDQSAGLSEATNGVEELRPGC
jgi:hypothetical protein